MTVEIKRKVSVILAAMVAAVFGLVAFVAPVAQAADGNIVFDTDEGPNTGTITVHKHVGPVAESANDGSEVTVTNEAIDGVEFTVTPVNGIDLKNPEHWEKLDTLKFDEGTKVVSIDDANLTLSLGAESDPVETANGGKAVFEDLPLGVYLVRERDNNSGMKITKKAAPFFVVLPMPSVNADNENKVDWNYDVHAYPKNSVTEVVKSVDDADANVGGAKAGDIVKWTVAVTIPEKSDPNDKLTDFRISDEFDPRLVVVNDTDNPIKVYYTAKAVGSDPQELTKKTDFTVEIKEQKVVVTMTKTGLAKLEPNRGGKVEAVFPTRVKSVADENGLEIPNTATVYINDPDNKNGQNSNKVKTPWGKLVITKTDKDNAKLLAGAKFGIYKDEAAAGDPIATVTTDENGKATVILKAKDSAEAQTYRTYYVKEIAAPAGYITSNEVHEITFTPGEGQTVKVTVDLKVDNTKQNVPSLPLTGASGQLLMIVGGLAIVLMGAGVGLVAYKRNRA